MAIAQTFLFLSIVNSALTAPVVVRGPAVHEVRVNVVDVADDGAVTSQKRYSPLSLTDGSLPPSPDYFSPSSSPLRPRDDPNPKIPDHSSSSERPQSPDTPPPRQTEDPLSSSRLGAASGAPQSPSLTGDEVDSPRPGTVTKDLLSSSRLNRPLIFAAPVFNPEAKDSPGPSRDPRPTEPETLPGPETENFIDQLSVGPSNPAQYEPEPEPETKESLGRFLKGKFIRRAPGREFGPGYA